MRAAEAFTAGEIAGAVVVWLMNRARTLWD